MLHGCTQNPDDFAAGTRMNALAEAQGWLVLYPAQAGAANGSGCWNWFRREDQRREEGEPSLIAGMAREVRARYEADARRVYVAGLSAGGAMAAVMGAVYPELFAAVGVHSGLPYGAAHDLPSALAAMREGRGAPQHLAAGAARPTIVFHGDRDATVHPRNGEGVVQAARGALAGAALGRVVRGEVPGGHRYTRTVYAGAEGRPVVEGWLVHGAGHAWSGGSPRGSYTDPRGPDAAREMLRFFSAHAAAR
jgi:poly(hydroxyalkanoate) depolymerase family esterase